MEKLRTQESSIHGQGAFAVQKIVKGEIIKWDASHVLIEAEFENLRTDKKKYVARLGEQLILMQVPARYVNHSCNPNIVPIGIGEDMALRDIEEGEEITADYLKSASEGESIDCNCRSENCQGRIRTY